MFATRVRCAHSRIGSARSIAIARVESALAPRSGDFEPTTPEGWIPPVNVAELRREYARASLDVADVEADPMAQFAHWLHAAVTAQVLEPTAMSLATVSAAGQPSCRMVLLKGHDARGLVFYTSYAGRKAAELEHSGRAALAFYWSELERQVRIEGTIERTSPEESDAYFASRPLGSRIGAVVSPQSRVVPDRAYLEQRFAEAALQLGETVARPEHWGGYRLLPHYLEFWQGRPNRLHDRIAYRRSDGSAWVVERLAP